MDGEVTVEKLAAMLNDIFDQRSTETGWTQIGTTIPWGDDRLPDRYREAIRMTARDILKSDLIREMVLVAAVVSLDEAAKDWVAGERGGVGSGIMTMGSDRYVSERYVAAFLRRRARGIEEEMGAGD